MTGMPRINSKNHKSLLGEAKLAYPLLPAKEQLFCFYNKIIPPNCGIDNSQPAYFRGLKYGYAPVSIKYWKALVRFDANVICEWLKWEHLLKAGLDYGLAKKRQAERFYETSRLFFRPVKIFDKTTVNNHLLSQGYAPNLARAISDELDISNILSIDTILDRIAKINSHHNTTIDHYLAKGFDLPEAKLKLLAFQRRGAEVTNQKRLLDSAYDEAFKLSRLPGFMANMHTSKMESAIKDELILRGYVVDKLTSKIDKQTVFSQSTPSRSWFVHDFYLKKHNIVIEYNGTFWHQDHEFEIKKAKHCININKSRYLILWEGAFKSASAYVDYIESVLKGSDVFSSTSEDDLVKFVAYDNALSNQLAWDQTFLDVAERLAAMSKCQSKKVCAIAVKDFRIIATGLNGSVRGAINCNEKFPNCVTEANREEHHIWSLANEIHAEASLIAEAARLGISLKGCTIYVSLQPCPTCSTYITALDVERVVYQKAYDKGDIEYTLSLFKSLKIPCHQHERGW